MLGSGNRRRATSILSVSYRNVSAALPLLNKVCNSIYSMLKWIVRKLYNFRLRKSVIHPIQSILKVPSVPYFRPSIPFIPYIIHLAYPIRSVYSVHSTHPIPSRSILIHPIAFTPSLALHAVHKQDQNRAQFRQLQSNSTASIHLNLLHQSRYFPIYFLIHPKRSYQS